MCGIAGKLWYRAPVQLDSANVLMEGMAAAIAFRGPDGQGTWVNPVAGIALTHSRLAIIDLDPRSKQPMPNQDGTIRVTFNGEIYNYQKLRRELDASANPTWRTESDTEVLLRLYEEHGPERVESYLNRLRGMFAVGIWDDRRRLLLLARDPLGKKPLYYSETKDGLVFGSTIQALFQDRGVQRRPNFNALQLYLQFGYVPAPETAFEGIHKLAGGHYLLADASGIRRVAAYWEPNFEPKWNLTETELKTEILERLEEATLLRMISDVPLGTFLSGGIDSSAVVAMMSRHSPRPVKSFSVSFPGYSGDESVYARQVAKHFGCDHTELQVQIRPDHLPEIVRHYEEPFADAAAIPTYFMSQAARRHVTVVLNGDGGDEDFAGYTLKHRAYARAESLRFPELLKQGILGVGQLLPNFQSEGSTPYRMRKSLRVLGGRNWRRNAALMEVFAPSDLSLTMPSAQGSPSPEDIMAENWNRASRFKGLDRELYFSLALHLPEQLLVKVDRASMAWALEARSPLLDREFVDFCARIPAGFKLHDGESKYIFRRAMSGILPDEILTRGKQGFIPPLGQWLRNELQELVRATLGAQDSFVAQLVSPLLVRRIVDEHLTGQKDHQRRLYALLNLELWERLLIRTESL